jgi:lipopolysaccharide export system permease protein
VTTLARYIARTLAANVLLALSALVVVFSVINLAQELENVGVGRYGIGEAFAFVVLTLPAEALELFPAAALLGGVLALGGMAARNELIALGSAGIARGRLIRLVLQATLLLVAAAMLLGELVAAPMARHAHIRRSVSLSEGSALTTAHGFWARDGTRFVNVRTALADGTLRDVYVYEFDEERSMRQFTYARGASYEDGEWKLHDLVESTIGDDGVQAHSLPERQWRDFLSPKRLRVLILRPEDVSLADLYTAIASLRGRGESAARHELAFWRRATMPVVATVMVFLGLPLVLSVKRMANLGQRIVLGALLGIGFQMLSQTFGQFVLSYQLSPVLGALLIPALGFGLGLWALRHVR